MACLAFGRAALLSHPSFGDRSLEDVEWCSRQLAVPEEPARLAAEGAVFAALAAQVTAFICNLDEATVNCGAAGPAAIHISSRCGLGSGGRAAPRRASGGSPVPTEPGTPGGSPASPASPAAPAAPALFRRLRARTGVDSGFGWRDARAAFELAMRRENRVERLVARSDPAAAEKRLQQRLLVARLEAVAFRGCSGGGSLFDALSLALWGTTAFGPALRALGVAHATAHPQEYRGFLGDDWEAYLGAMSRQDTPGDELMLRAVADHFGMPVNIVSSDAFMWFQRYSPLHTLSRREPTLAFLGPNTWMPVRRQSAMTALRLSISGGSEWRAAREVRRKMGQQDAQAAA